MCSGHYWHALLDSKIMPSRPTSSGAVLAKLAADQLMFAPLATAFFMVYLKVAEGHPQLALPFLQVPSALPVELAFEVCQM